MKDLRDQKDLTIHDVQPIGDIQARSKQRHGGTSPITNSALLRPYGRTLHRALWWVLGRGRLLMSDLRTASRRGPAAPVALGLKGGGEASAPSGLSPRSKDA